MRSVRRCQFNDVTLAEEHYNEYFTIQDMPEEWLHALKAGMLPAAHDPSDVFVCLPAARAKGSGTSLVIGANNDELVYGLSFPMLSSVWIPWETIGATVGETMHQLLLGRWPRRFSSHRVVLFAVLCESSAG